MLKMMLTMKELYQKFGTSSRTTEVTESASKLAHVMEPNAAWPESKYHTDQMNITIQPMEFHPLNLNHVASRMVRIINGILALVNQQRKLIQILNLARWWDQCIHIFMTL